MAVKTFYKSLSYKKISKSYNLSLTSRDGTAIPSGSTITNFTWKLWMSNNTDAVSSYMKFYYWADYENSGYKPSTDKYYYIGSSDNHYNSSSNSPFKSMTTLDTGDVTNMNEPHNCEVSISASELSSLNKSFIAERCIGVTTITDTVIRCSNTSSYSADQHYCHGIEVDIEYTPPIIPGNPTFIYPAAASRTTYNTKPWFRFTSGTDATEFYYRVDSDSWQSFSCSANSTYDKQWSTALSAGSHTLYIYNTSSTSTVNSAGTTGTSRAFTVGTPQAAVSAGAVIDDATIDGLQTNIRDQQYYYGQTQTTFTTCDVGTVILDDHIDALETAIEALPHPTSLTSIDAGSLITAAIINNIRTALLNA